MKFFIFPMYSCFILWPTHYQRVILFSTVFFKTQLVGITSFLNEHKNTQKKLSPEQVVLARPEAEAGKAGEAGGLPGSSFLA